jgi:RNA polymerase sigma factor (sigma-70 family)
VPSWVSRDDLFQVAMEAVCRAAPRYDETRASFPTFAGHRADGAIRDYLRRERPGTRHNPQPYPLSLDEPLPHADGSGEIVTVADLFPVEDPEPADDRLAQQLFAAVDRLPGPRGRIMRLYAEAGLTQAEIGELEGVTESRVNQQLKAARAQLQPVASRLLAA